MSYSLSFSKAILVAIFVADKVAQGMYDFVPTKLVSESLNIPKPTAVKILQGLAKSGIIETREGAKGGIRLAMSADDVTILSIFNAIEFERPLFRADLNIKITGEKPTRSQQAIRTVLEDSERRMKTSLAEVTIADLVNEINS